LRRFRPRGSRESFLSLSSLPRPTYRRVREAFLCLLNKTDPCKAPHTHRFDQLAEDLRVHVVVEAAGDLLMRVIQRCNWGRKNRPLITGTVNTKIYLAAYLIAANPRNVFDEIGELESKVMAAATPLVNAFHEAAELLKLGTHWKQIAAARRLPGLLCTYLRTFKAWKMEDERRLAGRLRRALKGIEETISRAREKKSQAEEEEEAEEEGLDQLEQQRQKLEAKLRQIGGLDGGGGGGGGASAGVGGATAATVVKTHNVQDLGAGGVASGGGGVTNEQLAHELLVDGDFKLDDQVLSPSFLTPTCPVFPHPRIPRIDWTMCSRVP
jgi:hypothetical protein